MKKILLILVLLFVLLAGAVSAKNETETIGSLKFTRISPDYVLLGEQIWVAVQIENTGSGTKIVNFIEKLGNADFNESAATYTDTEWGDKFWFYEWTVTLPAGGKTTLLYWIIPKDTGTYVFSPAKAIVEGQANFLKPMNIRVMCNNNANCEKEFGENYLTCIEDCPAGGDDGICNAAADGMCDTDCEKGLDKDCAFSIDLMVIAGIAIFVAVIAVVIMLTRRKK